MGQGTNTKQQEMKLQTPGSPQLEPVSVQLSEEEIIEKLALLKIKRGEATEFKKEDTAKLKKLSKEYDEKKMKSYYQFRHWWKGVITNLEGIIASKNANIRHITEVVDVKMKANKKLYVKIADLRAKAKKSKNRKVVLELGIQIGILTGDIHLNKVWKEHYREKVVFERDRVEDLLLEKARLLRACQEQEDNSKEIKKERKKFKERFGNEILAAYDEIDTLYESNENQLELITKLRLRVSKLKNRSRDSGTVKKKKKKKIFKSLKNS